MKASCSASTFKLTIIIANMFKIRTQINMDSLKSNHDSLKKFKVSSICEKRRTLLFHKIKTLNFVNIFYLLFSRS